MPAWIITGRRIMRTVRTARGASMGTNSSLIPRRTHGNHNMSGRKLLLHHRLERLMVTIAISSNITENSNSGTTTLKGGLQNNTKGIRHSKHTPTKLAMTSNRKHPTMMASTTMAQPSRNTAIARVIHSLRLTDTCSQEIQKRKGE
jgi:hypothetical protein